MGRVEQGWSAGDVVGMEIFVARARCSFCNYAAWSGGGRAAGRDVRKSRITELLFLGLL
jgi:hypothetical protein